MLSESLVLEDTLGAVYAHRDGDMYVINSLNVDEYLERIGKDNYLIISDTSDIPTNRLGEDDRTVRIFKDQAKEYGLFLQDVGIKSIGFWMYNGKKEEQINSESRPFATQLRLLNIDLGSSINGNSRELDFCKHVYGLKRA